MNKSANINFSAAPARALLLTANAVSWLVFIAFLKSFIFNLSSLLISNSGRAENFLKTAFALFLMTAAFVLIAFVFRKIKVPGKLFCFAAALAITIWNGYGPTRESVAMDLSKYRYLGNGIYSFAPNVDYSDRVEGGKTFKYNIGANGFRGCRFSTTAAGKTIVLVGDSYFHGMHLETEDTLCSKLGEELNRKGIRDFNIQVMAFPGANFSSYIKMANYYLQNNPAPDFFLIEFLSDNDLRKNDSNSNLYNQEHSILIKAADAFLGNASAVSRMYDYLGLYRKDIYSGAGGRAARKADFGGLGVISKKSKTAILSYTFCEGEFRQRIRDSGVKEIIQLKWPADGYAKINKYQIPNDGHPTGLLNSLLAKQIAEFIYSNR